MNWGKVDRTRKRASMHSADGEVELSKGQVPSCSGIDDLEEQEINRLLDMLESTFGIGGPTQAD